MAKPAQRLARAVSRGTPQEGLAAVRAWRLALPSETLLLTAVRRGRAELVEELCPRVTERERSLALREAIRSGRASCVRTLVKLGALPVGMESVAVYALETRQWECLLEALPLCSDWWLEQCLHMGAGRDAPTARALLDEMMRRGLAERVVCAAEAAQRSGPADLVSLIKAMAVAIQERDAMGLALPEGAGELKKGARL